MAATSPQASRDCASDCAVSPMSNEVPIAVSAAYRCSLLAMAIRETVRPS
ncbi:hypothetical protein SPURM210S_06734 [Streptomyces purpurascens]